MSIFLVHSKFSPLALPRGGGGVFDLLPASSFRFEKLRPVGRRLLTYFPTLVPEFKNDKISNSVCPVLFWFVLDFAVSAPLAPVTTVRNGTTSFSFYCEFVYLNETADNGNTKIISEWMYNNRPISGNNTKNKR